MQTQYTQKEIEDLMDGKLSDAHIHKMLSNFKDANRFDTVLRTLQERVSWDNQIVLPYGSHLYIVKSGEIKADPPYVVKCDCGHEFGSYKQNWKFNASIHVRKTKEDLEEIYPKMMHCEPGWMELREYFCPGCLTLLEVEAVPPGYPIVFDFQPDLETFYQEWLGRDLP